jgi:hypothetical protein
MILDIEQAITAAIEEDRKTRECCKQEREACAMMVQEVYERELKIFANLKEYTDAPHCILEDLMNAIRARSEGEKKGELDHVE